MTSRSEIVLWVVVGDTVVLVDRSVVEVVVDGGVTLSETSPTLVFSAESAEESERSFEYAFSRSSRLFWAFSMFTSADSKEFKACL